MWNNWPYWVIYESSHKWEKNWNEFFEKRISGRNKCLPKVSFSKHILTRYFELGTKTNHFWDQKSPLGWTGIFLKKVTKYSWSTYCSPSFCKIWRKFLEWLSRTHFSNFPPTPPSVAAHIAPYRANKYHTLALALIIKLNGWKLKFSKKIAIPSIHFCICTSHDSTII